jgi:PAS domain S-box-containing protein
MVWSALAAASLLLGLMHFARWASGGRTLADLIFSVVALAFVLYATAEIHTLYAQSPAEWVAWVRISHLPLGAMVIGTALFVREYFGTGRAWMLGLLIGVRAVILAINFSVDTNFNFERVDSLERITFLGDTVATVGNAVVGRWQILGLLSTLLLVAFVLDASVSLWRRGGRSDRRRAAVIGGGVLAFVILAGLNAQLVIYDVWNAPFLIVPSFTVALLAMAYELGRESLHAARLARDLDDSERRVELAADAAEVGLCEWDRGSGKLWATQRARRIFGLLEQPATELSGWLERVHPDDAERIVSELQTALADGRELRSEFRVCLPGSGTRWVAVNGKPEAAGGRPRTRVRGVIRDVTRQRETQAEMLELRRELAHSGRVSVLGQLASSLAHELSQPLGAILRNTEAAELLLRAPEPDLEELKAIVADIHRDDRRAGEVIDRLRALLKRRRLDLEPVSLTDVISDVTSLLRADAASRHVDIVWSAEPSLPVISGDRVHLSQVMMNLVINAMDAVMDRKPSERRVVVDVRRISGGSIELTVRDNGGGIPADSLARIFEPFFTTKAAGMGMGLSVCRTIVDAHGGTLTAENAPEGGAIFRVILPAVA